MTKEKLDMNPRSKLFRWQSARITQQTSARSKPGMLLTMSRIIHPSGIVPYRTGVPPEY
jgi:hypothetical protein